MVEMAATRVMIVLGKGPEIGGVPRRAPFYLSDENVL
jgi:hypothetical protein